MDNGTAAFVEDGMKRYRQASRIMKAFQDQMEERLKSILDKRSDWGKLEPKESSRASTTRTWKEYPTAMALREFSWQGEDVQLGITINWYESPSDYPFYNAWVEPKDPYRAKFTQFEWSSDFDIDENKLIFYPNPDDFDLDRDFTLLLDEFLRFFNG